MLAELREPRLKVVLDTFLLWNRWCLIRLGLVYRGRTLPAGLESDRTAPQ
ncbi:MAG: hypothetical protein V2J55_01955 [Candidatus Competibacteraceae bacterium]|nr:hypothetical protein [Candidatus Competibacteraceae bacterium]